MYYIFRDTFLCIDICMVCGYELVMQRYVVLC